MGLSTAENLTTLGAWGRDTLKVFDQNSTEVVSDDSDQQKAPGQGAAGWDWRHCRHKQTCP